MDCSAHCAATDRLFGAKAAEADLRRYRRKGPDPSTRLMLEELRRWPIDGVTLLDIGGGIGVLGLELLAAGARRVVQVEASTASLAAAQRQVVERGWGDRLQAVHGDFAALTEPLDPTDIVTLDRVVCCYPDYERLLARASGCARAALALSYPRDRWYVRVVFALEDLWRRISRSAFRTFVHPSARLAAVLERSGLRRVSRRGTAVWAVDLYRREEPSRSPAMIA
jgi:magnesium-protoporphyrin O-methyltransferase